MFFKKYKFLLILVLFFVPSCIKYYKLSKKEFPQGQDLQDEREVRKSFVRTASIYDQFATKAVFDILWLSDQARIAYVDINGKRRGKDDQAKQALLRRQLEENRHWITFCVLADIRDKSHISLNDKNSIWSLYLVTKSGERILPINIKEIDLEPEYQFIFGHKFNLFKRSYVIKFPAADLSGKLYVQDGDVFKLVISSPYKYKEIKWGEKDSKNEKVLKDEDYYWI